MQNPEKVNPRELVVDTVNVGANSVRLLSCEHKPRKMFPKNPWPTIEREIGKSDLVVLEYFPHELEHTVFKTPIIGSLMRLDARRDGIYGFFSRTAELAVYSGADLAVADIANRPLYSAYNLGSRLTHALVTTEAMFLPLPTPFQVLAIVAFAHMAILNLSEASGRFIFHPTAQKFDGAFFDTADARRLFTAKALLQIAEAQPERNILYIAPAAHTKRVKRYMEDPDSFPFRLRDKLYRIMAGLDRNIRYYRYNSDQDLWQKIASEPIR